ncbi:MAG TPA: aromatic ring-opening dioxygenase subunit LigB [Thermomicrobiales bacterium]|nr:aromatic ring-opening dioxygenase subunit LigB [Thermomicrobiales bacterium]
MPLVFAAIAPHGFPIIDDLSEDAEGALVTRAAMHELGRRCATAKPDVLVIAGPHGVRVDGAICLAHVARGAGTLRWQDRAIGMNIPVDGEMTDAIAAAARARGVPIALAGYAGNRRDQSVIPLDWGVITPLWFLGHDRQLEGAGDVLSDPPDRDIGPPAVIVTPSRALPRSAMVAFGRAVSDAAAGERRVAFIASCDWAHTHREDGPYGFHPAAARVDALVVNAIRDNEPGRLIDLSEEDVRDAAIDGLWQTLMLAGVKERVPLAVDLLSYEAPTYYGMLVAVYTPESS